jgi:hypothetical protein
LEDLTPDLRNKPHTYRDTGKVSLQIQVVAVTETTSEPEPEQLGVTESHSTVTLSQSHCDRESHEETSKRQEKRQEEGSASADTPPVEQQGKKPKPKKKKDERIVHPAIQAFRRAMNLYPKKTWWDDIIQTVGTEEADVEFWYTVCHDYDGCGWNKMNVKNMLVHYVARELPEVKGGNGNGSRQLGAHQGTGDEGAALRRRQEQISAAFKRRSREARERASP